MTYIVITYIELFEEKDFSYVLLIDRQIRQILLGSVDQKLEIVIRAVDLNKTKTNPNPVSCEERWKLFDTKSELDLDFSFTKVATQIRELRGGKGIANSTLNNFYQRKTNPRKITVEAVQEWVDKEKERGEENVDSINNTV